MSAFANLTLPTQAFPWQQGQWLQLTDRLQFNRLPHALLFTGPHGVGKLHFTAALIGRIFCIQPHQGLACGQCKGCYLYQSGNHPDVKIIECLPKKKNISVEQIREVSDFMSKQAQLGGYRCVVIALAEQMSESAANALLKVLEEPGEQSLFILLACSMGAVKATIKSRCQILRFQTPPFDQALAWLKTKVTSKEQAELLLHLSAGAPLAALDIQEKAWFKQRADMIKHLLALRQGQADPLTVAAAWQNHPPQDVLWAVYEWMLDCLKLRQGLTIVNQDVLILLEQLSLSVEVASLFNFSEILLENYMLLAHEGNPNILLMVEGLMIHWSRLP
ncbi:MAG TPA: DNA polymerase III subunit delta' [Pseudomonadales bacterium]|nr:DNA polymerase III subunit delta' [Pseudomonadales bacterium]